MSDFTSFYNQNGFNELENQVKNTVNTNTQRIVGSYDEQKNNTNLEYNQLARQSYISYMQSKADLPQVLASMGYTGGLSESRAIGLEANRQDNLNAISLQRQNALFSLDRAINDAYASGELSIAEKLSDIYRQAQSQWSDYKVRQEENAYRTSRDTYNDTFNLDKFEYQKEQEALSQAYSQAQFEYKKQQDEAEAILKQMQFEYQKKQDQLEYELALRKLALQEAEKAASSAATSIPSPSSSSSTSSTSSASSGSAAKTNTAASSSKTTTVLAPVVKPSSIGVGATDKIKSYSVYDVY